MEGFPIIVVAAVLMVGLALLVNKFSNKEVVKEQLKKAKKKQISSVENGETVKIVGKVEVLGNPLIAPLSGRKCCYYNVLIEEKVGNDGSSESIGHSWKTIIKEEVLGEFVIRDGDDYAIIDTPEVKVYSVEDKSYWSGFRNDPTDRLEKYLKYHGHSSTFFFGMNKTIRYKEGVLEEGEVIGVLGMASWKEIDQENFSIPAKKILTLSSSGENPFVHLSDDPDILK